MIDDPFYLELHLPREIATEGTRVHGNQRSSTHPSDPMVNAAIALLAQHISQLLRILGLRDRHPAPPITRRVIALQDFTSHLRLPTVAVDGMTPTSDPMKSWRHSDVQFPRAA